VRLHVGDATPITLTSDHLIFLAYAESGTDVSGQTPVFADRVRPGDRVWLNRNKLATATEITHVTYHELKGIYAPFTDSGTILVDGVKQRARDARASERASMCKKIMNK
jgi:hypothetical protein